MADTSTLTARREFVFLYDIRMGNPNGDPDENRPRVLPDKTHYVTDVRLKRFVRDFLKTQGKDILVDTIEGKTTNLTGRVAEFLARNGIQKVESPEKIVEILLGAFIDARLFGSTFAFKPEKGKGKEEGESQGKGKEKGKVASTVFVQGHERRVEWAQPRTLTGAVQIAHGEVKHRAQEVDINGTSVFASDETKGRGTFTTYYALRYALVGFNGVANEHNAKASRMTDDDYDTLLRAMWYGVRSAANTRTKRGQVPRLLINVVYKQGEEFQFGNLCDYVKLTPRNGKQETEWASPEDYTLDLSLLAERLERQAGRIARLDYCASPDVALSPEPSAFALPAGVVRDLDLDRPVG
jgi:CRISPR-associated protein Csh2